MKTILHRFEEFQQKFTSFMTSKFISSLVLVLTTNLSFSQCDVLKGNITSKEDNQPLPGVSKHIKGTNKSTSTNAN